MKLTYLFHYMFNMFKYFFQYFEAKVQKNIIIYYSFFISCKNNVVCNNGVIKTLKHDCPMLGQKKTSLVVFL